MPYIFSKYLIQGCPTKNVIEKVKLSVVRSEHIATAYNKHISCQMVLFENVLMHTSRFVDLDSNCCVFPFHCVCIYSSMCWK